MGHPWSLTPPVKGLDVATVNVGGPAYGSRHAAGEAPLTSDFFSNNRYMQ